MFQFDLERKRVKEYLDATVNEAVATFLLPLSGVCIGGWFWSNGQILYTLCVALMSVAFFWKSRRNLQLLDTGYPASEKNFTNCQRVAVLHCWKTVSSLNMVRLEFETSASSGSWGELITIIFTPEGIKINSRPSPYKRYSIASFGRNRKNVQMVLDILDY
ncbi:hypothetical protein [Photobacterium lutimaris]|uniref:Uncharacterized protein n=1 Tax=Photobacterium lutimaris TaxID=388278 RepID=A0A2T3J0K5_9GAMM|nr:hypothetical protein [Photobacterium lutimaris]PSU34580.1 hypothetical protein C9I99_05590 [Photobacterium lutimaris]